MMSDFDKARTTLSEIGVVYVIPAEGGRLLKYKNEQGCIVTLRYDAEGNYLGYGFE